MGPNRNEGGRFTPEHTDEEVLAAVRSHEPAATSEVAEELGITRQGADYRLRRLHDKGLVSNKKIGASLVWFAPSETVKGNQSGADTPREEISETADALPGGSPDTPTSTEDTARSGPDITNSVTLEDVEFPGGRERDECLAAIYATRDHLREHGPSTMRELVTEVMPEHPVGYAVPDLEPGDRYRGAWWRRVVKPGLKALPDVQAPSPGASDWRYHPNPDTEAEFNG